MVFKLIIWVCFILNLLWVYKKVIVCGVIDLKLLLDVVKFILNNFIWKIVLCYCFMVV